MSTLHEAPARADLASSDAGTPQDNQFVTFNVAGEMFAVPMAPVQEIIRVPDVARMPLAPPALDGLANLRGRVLPIMSLRRIFGTAPLAHDDATRALVINLGQPLGFVVDRVASVISVEAGEIEPAASIQSVVQADYLTGVIKRPDGHGGHQLMLVLDFERLVADQFAAMAQAQRQTGPVTTGREARSAHASPEAPVNDELRLVSFTVCDQEYAIDIANVQEIVQVPASITGVPNTALHVLGVISLRQRLLPLVSLRSLFGLPALTPDEHHRIVVVALSSGAQVGLVTDAVKEVLSVPRSCTEAVPAVLAQGQQLQEFEAICRLDQGRRLVSILAPDRLLGWHDVQAVLQAAPSSQASQASHAFLDGQDDPMDRHDRTRAVTTDDDAQVVIFRLGAEEFGVPIMSVQEIVRVPDTLTRVPKTPAFVEGVINLRGTVLPVIDQRKRLGMAAIERNDRQRIMVYTLHGLRTGFIVDSVAEVLRIARAHIEPAPELSEEQRSLITQVAKLDQDRRLVMLIEPGQLLGARDLQAVSHLSAEREAAAPAVAYAQAA